MPFRTSANRQQIPEFTHILATSPKTGSNLAFILRGRFTVDERRARVERSGSHRRCRGQMIC
jgi:hypothetical protein